MHWITDLAATFLSTILDVLPIALIIFGFQLLVLRQRMPNLKKILIGFMYVLVGLAFFLDGLQMALFPLGKLMASQLTDPEFIHGLAHLADQAAELDWWDYRWVYLFAFAIGFSTTIAEPSLLAVAYRIVSGTPLHWYIIAGYILVMIQTTRAPRAIIALAYDSGGVTTSTVTVPLVAALGLGLASTIPGRSPLLDGFGLIAFASLFPIMSVIAYAQLAEWWSRRNSSNAGD